MKSRPESPLEIGPWDLDSDLKKLTTQFPLLAQVLESESQFSARVPSVSAWSAGEQVGHTILVKQLIATVIQRLLDQPQLDVEKSPASFTKEAFAGGVLPRGRAKAPKHVLPHDRTRQDFLLLFHETHRAWSGLASCQPELSDCRARYPHFAFGYLTPAEWVRFCAIHTAHHLKIVAEILEPNTWPR